MKNLFKWSGIVVGIAAMALFFMVSCKDPTDPDVTITFDLNGGSGATPTEQTATSYSPMWMPKQVGFSKTDSTLGGWNTKADGSGTHYNLIDDYWKGDFPHSNVTLYAEWYVIPYKLDWLKNHAESGGSYILEISVDERIDPQELYYYERKNITIILRGIGGKRTISVAGNRGTIFTVRDGVTLVLDENITLQGSHGYNNGSSLVIVSGGTLRMNAGSVITGNERYIHPSRPTSYFVMCFGGGVYVGNGGTFTMNGGEISGNTAYVFSNDRRAVSHGGGVYVDEDGTFTMNGGKISSNTAYASSAISSSSRGGGVFVGGTFTMNGGEISGNIVSGSESTSCYGGGVSGGAAYSGSYAVFSFNTGTFTKTGGTIYGYSASDTVNSNVVKNSSDIIVSDKGHAVYAYGNHKTGLNMSDEVEKRKETTAGPGVNLAFDGKVDPPTFSGDWDY